MVWMSLKEVIKGFLDELKAALKEYVAKQEAELKERLRKILTISIVGIVLLALAITLAGSASLFILIGSLRFFETFLPAWQAWLVIGAGAAIAASVLFLALAFIIRKQLSTKKHIPEESSKEETKSAP